MGKVKYESFNLFFANIRIVWNHVSMRLKLSCDIFREFSPDGRGVSIVGYITPCGRRLVTYDDILDYNRMALTDIPIEFFSLDLRINCLSVFKPHRKIVELKVRN